MKNLLFIFAIFLVNSFSLAQTPQYSSISEQFGLLKTASTDSERTIANEGLKALIRELLTSGEWITIGVADWPAGYAQAGEGDELVSVITWNSERSDRTQDYGGFVLYADSESELGYNWVELVHDRKEDPRDEGRSYRVDDWTGAIYYELVLTHNGKTPVYTMLGWDGANATVTRKIIETMIITNDRVRIGAPYIKKPEGLKKRHVLEYSDALQATVRYEPSKNRIVIDQLGPSDPSLLGQTAFYGPTLEYDAYIWDGKHWEFKKDVEVSNLQEKKSKRIYNNPKAYRRNSRNQ